VFLRYRYTFLVDIWLRRYLLRDIRIAKKCFYFALPNEKKTAQISTICAEWDF
jgi:hypothetical protein